MARLGRGHECSDSAGSLIGEEATGRIVRGLFCGESADEPSNQGYVRLCGHTGGSEAVGQAGENTQRDQVALLARLESGDRALEHQVIASRVRDAEVDDTDGELDDGLHRIVVPG